MNEGYSEIAPIMNRVKKRKIELEMLLTKHNQSHCSQKIMDLILKIEGLINKIKSLQMSVDVKGYTTSHSVPSGILHSKLLKELSQIKSEEQEIIEQENSLHALIANSSSIKEPIKKRSATKKSTPRANKIKTSEEDWETEEFISHVKRPVKKGSEVADANANTKSYYKPFKSPVTQLEKNRTLEVQNMVEQFRKIRNDLDSILSTYQGQKYRKKIMDLIIKVKAHINLLLSLQSSFKATENNTINHSAKVNYNYIEDQLSFLGKEKKEIHENQKILKAKIAREQREMIKQVYDSKEVINIEENKDPGMVNLLLKLGLIKKKK